MLLSGSSHSFIQLHQRNGRLSVGELTSFHVGSWHALIIMSFMRKPYPSFLLSFYTNF